MPPIRVLQIMPAMDAGGMETFVMNVYRAVDRSQVQFDFLYHYDKPCFYDAEIEALGGHITKLTVRQDNNIPKYLHDLRAFFTAHPEYKVIHGHYSGFGMFYNAVARRCGVPVRAGHSHNTAYEHNLVGQLDRLMSSRFDHDLTHRFACSQRAGEMLYGKHPFTVLPNGIMTDVFALHDPAARAAGVRAGLNLNARWFAFCDADDCYHKQFLDALYRAAQTTRCQIACCRYDCFTEDIPPESPPPSQTTVFQPPAHLDALLHDHRVDFGLWNKLYAHELITAEIMDNGLAYNEDLVANWQIFSAADGCA